MIDYAKTRTGDILRLTGVGAPGYAQLGDLLRVKQVQHNGVTVEDRHGKEADFLFNCGAADGGGALFIPPVTRNGGSADPSYADRRPVVRVVRGSDRAARNRSWPVGRRMVAHP